MVNIGWMICWETANLEQTQTNKQNIKHFERTCTEPCLSAGVRFPNAAPDFCVSGHGATPPFAFV